MRLLPINSTYNCILSITDHHESDVCIVPTCINITAKDMTIVLIFLATLLKHPTTLAVLEQLTPVMGKRSQMASLKMRTMMMKEFHLVVDPNYEV